MKISTVTRKKVIKVNLPQTESIAYAITYCDRERLPFPATFSNSLAKIMLCFEKISENLSRFLGLKVGTRILRRGRQIGTVDDRKKEVRYDSECDCIRKIEAKRLRFL